MSRKIITKRMSITKLKRLSNIEVTFADEGLTGILGPNGSGKTSILHALSCVYRPESNSNNQDYRYPKFFIPYIAKNTPYAYSWQDTEFQIEYSVGESTVSKTIKKGVNRWIPRNYNKRDQRWVKFLGLETALPDIESEKKVGIASFSSISPKLNQTHLKIKNKASYILDRDYNAYDDWTRSNHKKYIGLETSQSGKYTSLSMGAGEQRVFRILETVYEAPEYGLILIDEIDILLHQDALTKLLEVISEQAVKKHLQIIFTTHNHEILKLKYIYFRYIYQQKDSSNKERTFCLNDANPEVISRLTGTQQAGITIFVEDILSKAIVSQLCNTLGIQKHVKILKFGSSENCYTIAVGLFLSDQLNDNIILITDGDVDRTVEEKKAKIKAKYAGSEPGKEKSVIKILEHIKQFSIPENIKPEKFYIAEILKGIDNDMTNDNQELLSALRNCPKMQNHHEYLSYPISQIFQENEDVGYYVFAKMLSSTPSWISIVEPIKLWLNDRIAANNIAGKSSSQLT